MKNIDKGTMKYIVKSRSGKMYLYSDYSEAVKAAKEKSTKKALFTVYENGEPVVTFVNKKQLDKWQTLFEEKVSDGEVDNSSEIRFFENRLIYRRVQAAENKVRILHSFQTYKPSKSGKPYSRIKNYSITFHRDGRVVYYNGKPSYQSNCSIDMTREEQAVLIKKLAEYKPELRWINPECILDSRYYIIGGTLLIETFSRPNVNFVFDTFKKTAIPRTTWISRDVAKLFPRTVMSESELIPYLAEKVKVPCSKSFRKIYSQDFNNILATRNAMSSGIKDQNNILKTISFFRKLMQYDCCDTSNCQEFFRLLCEIKAESWVVKMFEQSDEEDIIDAFRMIDTYDIDKSIVKFIVQQCKNVASIHDSLEMYIRFQRNNRINRKIPYSDKEIERFNRTYGNITFSLAEDSKDLAVVGASMGICVGGYAPAAVAKETTIVKMIDTNKYVGCIEVRGNNVVQIKAKFNNPLKAEYKQPIDKWLSDCHLKVHTDDYQKIGNPWRSNYSYATIQPNEYHDANEHGTLRIIHSSPRYNCATLKMIEERKAKERKEVFDAFNKRCEEELYSWCYEMAKKYN